MNTPNEMGPEEIFDNISVTPALVDDQGDVFQCGKCKLTFTTLIEFLSHKRLHYSQQMDQISSQFILDSDQVGTVAFNDHEPSNQIWVWNTTTPIICENDLLNPSHACLEKHSNEITSKCIVYSPSSNASYLNNNTTKLKPEPNQEILPDASTVESISPVQSLNCSVCKKIFKTELDLFLHFRSHSGEKPFQCIICGRTFSFKSNLKKHMQSHRVWPDGLSKTLSLNNFTENPGYTCSYCQKTFPNYTGLKIHLREHGHQKVYKCIQKKCVAMFVDLDSLVSHVKTSHDVSEYHCHICSTIVFSLDEISNHLQTHKPSAPKMKRSSKFSCLYCHSAFKKPSHLSHHLATANHTNNCPVCDKTFVSERSLRRHLVLHSSSKDFRCDVCGKKFITKYYLDSHQLTHSREKCFSCSFCDVKCTRKDILMRHIKIHQPNKKKSCPFKSKLGCLMEFTRTDKLNLHIKSHTEKVGKKRKKIAREKISPKLKNSQEQSTIEIIIVPLSDKQCLRDGDEQDIS